MTDNDPTQSQRNCILAALNQNEYDAIAPALTPVHLLSHAVLYEPQSAIDSIYFPTTALISLVGLTQEGLATEVGMVGCDGMVGLPVFLGSASQPYQVITQLTGEALKLPQSVFQTACQQPGLQRLLRRYSHTRLVHVAQTAICNRFHPLEERLCRWLLIASDRVDSDQLHFTQEFLAQMIGARRAAVGLVASTLQTAGFIRYHRGNITILNREGLEDAACECYGIIQHELKEFQHFCSRQRGRV